MKNCACVCFQHVGMLLEKQDVATWRSVSLRQKRNSKGSRFVQKFSSPKYLAPAELKLLCCLFIVSAQLILLLCIEYLLYLRTSFRVYSQN